MLMNLLTLEQTFNIEKNKTILFTVVRTAMKLATTKSVNLNDFLCIVCEVSKLDHLR